MEPQDVMHGLISQGMAPAPTVRKMDFVQTSPKSSQQEIATKGEFRPPLPRQHVGFVPFHQQHSLQTPLGYANAQPSLSLSLERPEIYGNVKPQHYQERVSHVGGHTFDLEQRPSQQMEETVYTKSNVTRGEISEGAYQDMEEPDGYQGHQETYEKHQGMEQGDGCGRVQDSHGSLERGDDSAELQHVSASECPPHEKDVNKHFYPVALATHNAVVQDPELFMTTLDNFLTAFGTRLMVPKLDGVDLNLHAFYLEVTTRGGLAQVIKFAQWKEISQALGIPKPSISSPFALRKHYTNLLFHYEQVYYFRTEGPLVAPPVPLPGPVDTMEPAVDAGSPYEVPWEMLSLLKKKKSKLDPMQVFGVDPAAAIGTVVPGAINGKSEEGYFVTVVVGTEKLTGILYHVSADYNTGQYASVPSLLEGIGSQENTAGLEVQLYGKQKTEPTVRRKRNPNAPKRTRTGYNIYYKEQRAKLKQLYPDAKGLGKKVIEMWGQLSESEKAPYIARGNEERERYLAEYREKLKSQESQITEPAMDAGSSEQFGGEHDTGAYYVSHDYHVSLEPESDLQGGQPQSYSDMDQAYPGYDPSGPQSHHLESEMQGEHSMSEQAYEVQEDEGEYAQGPGSEEEEDGEQEEAYEGEEDDTVYPSEKTYEEQDGGEYRVSNIEYGTPDGTYPLPTNEALVQEHKPPGVTEANKQPYYGQDHGFVCSPILPQQVVGSQGPVHMKSIGQSPYHILDNGKVMYPCLPQQGHIAGSHGVTAQSYFAPNAYAYASAKREQEPSTVATSQEQAAYQRQGEAPFYPPYPPNQGLGLGIPSQQVTQEHAYRDGYAYPTHMPHGHPNHMPHGQMYTRPTPSTYPVRFPHSPYPMPWGDSQGSQYAHAYAPHVHRPQASAPEGSAAVPPSQVYRQDGGHGYQS